MKLSGLRRLATKRLRATNRRRVAAPALPIDGCMDHRAARRRTAHSDVEAPNRLARKLVGESHHGAAFVCCEENIEDDEAALESFMDYYKERLNQLKEEEGGTTYMCISGNLYMYNALADFADATGLFTRKQSLFAKVALYIIIFLQFFAPLGLLISSLKEIEFGAKGEWTSGVIGVHEFGTYHVGGHEYGFSHFAQRLLGLVFITLFLMNGFYVLQTDKIETKKLTEMTYFFQEIADKIPLLDDDGNQIQVGVPRPKIRWLWIGALMNSACLLLCSWAMVFMFIIEEGPKDVVLDAFGLAFLYNLDDIGGVLAFLDEKWDEEFLGDVFGELEEHEDRFLDAAADRRKGSFTPDNIYKVMRWIVWAMLIIQPLVYIFVEMKPKDQDD